ncbi:hypothetical protein QR680_016148 [Steinernema hermaphroditum]|uniref:Uncharacterized protein n=1 Tax=Steinernema hermaphroditum TaxID=289476 RepID=A0AA39LLY9_9BILA|nr:hypothetical protein QR680_016148 [Steinernema hermaphroditum]
MYRIVLLVLLANAVSSFGNDPKDQALHDNGNHYGWYKHNGVVASSVAPVVQKASKNPFLGHGIATILPVVHSVKQVVPTVGKISAVSKPFHSKEEIVSKAPAYKKASSSEKHFEKFASSIGPQIPQAPKNTSLDNKIDLVVSTKNPFIRYGITTGFPVMTSEKPNVPTVGKISAASKPFHSKEEFVSKAPAYKKASSSEEHFETFASSIGPQIPQAPKNASLDNKIATGFPHVSKVASSISPYIPKALDSAAFSKKPSELVTDRAPIYRSTSHEIVSKSPKVDGHSSGEKSIESKKANIHTHKIRNDSSSEEAGPKPKNHEHSPKSQEKKGKHSAEKHENGFPKRIKRSNIHNSFETAYDKFLEDKHRRDKHSKENKSHESHEGRTNSTFASHSNEEHKKSSYEESKERKKVGGQVIFRKNTDGSFKENGEMFGASPAPHIVKSKIHEQKIKEERHGKKSHEQ